MHAGLRYPRLHATNPPPQTKMRKHTRKKKEERKKKIASRTPTPALTALCGLEDWLGT